jgi:acyl-CoA synthetase (AMP-forming)/AMP-acid ligase II
MIFLCKTNLFSDYDLSSIKEIICGAASVSESLEEAVKFRFDNKVKTRQIYGMTESSTLVTYQKDVFKSGSIGSVVRGCLVKVIDTQGNALGPNQTGELCTKGLRVMKGYIGNEKATQETIDEDGWLHTGDVGYYDEDQQFFMIERLKELIKYNAFQVPPAEIEALLLTYPKVKEAGVIGIPDFQTGEKAMAFIVKQPGVDVTDQEIIEFVAKNLSKPKQLHGGVRFIDELPKTNSGKILRRALLESLGFKK